MDWDGLYEQHADDVLRICWRILGSRADVEDCVQETFIQAFQRESQEPILNWPGLLRRIAVMTSLAQLRQRKNRRHRPLPSSELQPVARGESPEQYAQRRELQERLRVEVAGLPDQEAAAFCLRYFECYSVTETARILSVSNGAVSAATFRARRQLERNMSDILTPGPPVS